MPSQTTTRPIFGPSGEHNATCQHLLNHTLLGHIIAHASAATTVAPSTVSPATTGPCGAALPPPLPLVSVLELPPADAVEVAVLKTVLPPETVGSRTVALME